MSQNEDETKTKDFQDKLVEGVITDEDWRSYVAQHESTQEFPFEVDEQVWVIKAGFQSPLGPFKIIQVLADNKFKLRNMASGAVYGEDVDGIFLHRNVYFSRA